MRTCTKNEKSQYALWGHVLKWKKKPNIWHKSWNANNENTVVLGRMYRSILSSCLGIEGQYGPPPSLRSGGQPVLRLNSSAWWQYWPIHPPQNYSIPPILWTSSHSFLGDVSLRKIPFEIFLPLQTQLHYIILETSYMSVWSPKISKVLRRVKKVF
mgnify:CR=1 FL=1